MNSYTTESDEYSFDKQNLHPGIYFVNIYDENGKIQTIKIVVN